MAYTPVSLGDIYQQAEAIKGSRQRQQMGALQLQQAQQDQANTQGINSALVANPDADLPTLIKAGGGLAGAQASTQVGSARTADLTNHYRQMYTAANQVANSDNPLATIQQVAPQFPQQYDAVHGQGSFAKIAQDPAQLKQQAAQVAQDALSGLVDPDKQFQAHQTMIENHYKQEGPGGELARERERTAAENARTQFTQGQENTRAGLARGVTMRGQDLENANRGVPSGYEHDPANPGALRPIAGGPHDPNAISQGLDSRSSVQFQRVVNAGNSAVESIKNISEMPAGTNVGWFAGITGHGQPTSIFAAGKAVLGRGLTSQASQSYQTMLAGVSRNLATLETSGLAPAGSLTHSMDALTMQPGDTGITQLRKMTEMRQIVVTNLEPQLSNPKLAAPQRQIIQNIVASVKKAVPFTHSDITKLEQSKNPQATIMDFAQKTGLPAQGAEGSTPASVPTASGPNGQKLYLRNGQWSPN